MKLRYVHALSTRIVLIGPTSVAKLITNREHDVQNTSALTLDNSRHALYPFKGISRTSSLKLTARRRRNYRCVSWNHNS